MLHDSFKSLLLLFIVGPTHQLSDSMATSGDAVTVFPGTPWNQFNGVTQLLYLRWFAYDGVTSGSTRKSYTAAFDVKVDDYSELVVPNSIL